MLRHRELFTQGSRFTGKCSPSHHSLIHTQCWQVVLPSSNFPLLISQIPSCLEPSLSLSFLLASSLASRPLVFTLPTQPLYYGQSNTCSCYPQSLSHVWLFVTLWLVALQPLPFMKFSRQEYWSELPFPPPGIFPTQGWNLNFLCLLLWHGGFPNCWPDSETSVALSTQLLF